MLYKKVYTRENCLIAIQIWEEHQVHRWKQKIGDSIPLSIFDATQGVTHIYYREDIWNIWGTSIAHKANSNPQFVSEIMHWYGEQLDTLEKIWHNKRLASVKDLIDFFDRAASAWVGLSVSYCLPDIKSISRVYQDLGMALRKRSADFLELTDHVIQNTLRDAFPQLGDLVKYITIEEVKGGALPSRTVLEERQKHYIYFGFEVYTNKDLFDLAEDHDIAIEAVGAQEKVKEVVGQTAMVGMVTGAVRVINKKSEMPLLQDGEILVVAMTTPDYLPAMRRAAAFVTDEGGITCHAAIVAREIGKPCIIGTKIATTVLKTGDIVEVNADKGVVRILRSPTS